MKPELLKWLASCNKDPVRFVLGAFPWGVKGTLLEKFTGPEQWQLELLIAIRDGLITPNQAIQIATASGHGIGKSALVAWIILWAFMTAPDTLGVVTANTETQLKTKTWARLGEWFNMIWFARDHFSLTATALLSKDPTRERTWRIDMIPWSEKNPAAFAGMHNRGKRILMVFDEASEIPDVIWETAEGALTDADTEIIWLVFGNPTKNSGRFKECFDGGRFADVWQHRRIDSRTVSFTNKTKIAQWEKSYGEDSDFFRIRVKGVFPRHGLMEFFLASDVEGAMTREVTTSITDPLALGVDVARYGSNASVIFPRKGRDARGIPRQRFSGLSTVDLAAQVFATATNLHADGIFIDGGGVGGGVVDNVRHMHLHCYDVQFGGKNIIDHGSFGIDGEKYANMRAGMYGALRQWLKAGAIPDEPSLKDALLAIRYTFNNRDEILLEPKEDILEENPEIELDDVDALALSFAYPLAPHREAGGEHPHKPPVETEYNPFSPERMVA